MPGLGIAQIIAWGSLYYSISVLAAAIGAELALSPSGVFGAFSLGLAMSGVAAPAAGRAIDRFGGRRVLAAGSVVAAVALWWMSRAASAVEYYLAWCVGGVAMAMTLYDAAFATLSHHFGTSYRKALTALTLFGGFASTVFWPLSQLGLAQLGWRDTLLAFAALQVAVCLPLHAWLIPPGCGPAPAAPAVGGAAPPRARVAPLSGRFVALAAAFALNAFIISAVSAHLIGLLTGSGVAPVDVVWIAALIGPMQVAGRVLEITAGRNLRPVTTAVAAFSLFFIGLLALAAVSGPRAGMALAFAVLYGLANGVMTIVRGTIPAALFGRDAYGSLLGRLAAPAFAAKAAAPVMLASLAAPHVAPGGSLALLLALAAASFVLFLVAIRRRPDGRRADA